MLLLGIDIGTTGAKAVVFDDDGRQCGYGFEEYGIACTVPGWAEQDAEKIWESAKRVISQAVQESGGHIGALSVSVQGDAIIPIDRHRRAIAPAQLGMDYRGGKEAKELEDRFGARELFNLTGIRPHPMNSLVKMVWLKNHQPEIYEKAWKLVTYSDYILGKLGSDEIIIDYSMASRTMAFSLQAGTWCRPILSALGISTDKLGKPVPSGTVVGTLTNPLAGELGIAPGALIVAGGHDQTCAAFGAGVVRAGLALDSHGTAEVISTALDSPRLDDMMFQSYYPCSMHVVSQQYFTFSLNHTGGILLKWFAENFCGIDALEAARTNARLYEMVLEKAPEGPSPVIVLPYFNGSGTPTCDLRAKGAILGLTMATTRYDIAKAIVEALSFELRINLETMHKAGIAVSSLRCVGGGARSPIGLQNKADITGLPVSTLKVRESACLGAALSAGIAAGVYRTALEAADVVAVSETRYPDEKRYNLYTERYCTYGSVYDTIKETLYRI